MADLGRSQLAQLAKWMGEPTSLLPLLAAKAGELKLEMWLRYHIALPRVHETRSML